MQFAPDWNIDTAHLSDSEPAPAREQFARRAWDLIDRDVEAAFERASSGTEQFPTYATGWYVLACALDKLEWFDDAAHALERCLALEESFLSAWELLAAVNHRRDHAAAARAAEARLEELLNGHPPVRCEAPPEPKSMTARSKPSSQDHDEEGRRLVIVRPARTGSFETPTLAEVYRRQGLLDRALGVYRRILERHPEDTGVRSMVNKLEAELETRGKPVPSSS